jgi:hypothetical protein
LDRKRPKKGSNDDWTHPHDPDARITKMNKQPSKATAPRPSFRCLSRARLNLIIGPLAL